MKTSFSPLMLALMALTATGALAQTAPPSKTFTPGAFDSLQLAGSAQVRYRQGERDEVIVEGDEAMQARVSLEMRGNSLTVRTQGSWWQWSKPRVQLQVMTRELRHLGIHGAADFVAADPVSTPELRVTIAGAGLARFDQLKAGLLRFSVSGAGDGQFAGQADELRIAISGKGDVQAEQLAARRVQVGISGLGKARVWALQELQLDTSGVGTVEYWGSPKVIRHSSGVSTVNALGPKIPAPPLPPAPPAQPAAPTPPALPATAP